MLLFSLKMKKGQVMLESIVALISILIFVAGISKLVMWAVDDISAMRASMTGSGAAYGGGAPNLTTDWW